jgi:hypothetical protein
LDSQHILAHQFLFIYPTGIKLAHRVQECGSVIALIGQLPPHPGDDRCHVFVGANIRPGMHQPFAAGTGGGAWMLPAMSSDPPAT